MSVKLGQSYDDKFEQMRKGKFAASVRDGDVTNEDIAEWLGYAQYEIDAWDADPMECPDWLNNASEMLKLVPEDRRTYIGRASKGWFVELWKGDDYVSAENPKLELAILEAIIQVRDE